MRVIFDEHTHGIHIKTWCEEIEDSAMEQVNNLTNLPFAFHHIALMPDCHAGYGMPVGGVLATKDYIVPNAVGVDIGCGMCCVKTNFQDDPNPETLKRIMGTIRGAVPMGVGRSHKTPHEESQLPQLRHTKVIEDVKLEARHQLGTLGSGNHFIEFQKDEHGFMYIMLHSGSRKLGKVVCDHYNNRAKEMNELWFSSVSTKQDLAFLPVKSYLGRDYIDDMLYASEYAYINRRKMLFKIMEITSNLFKKHDNINISYKTMKEGQDMIVNIHHNYANLENHFGQNVWVHRKGATSAKAGQIGLIPGSQGTASYVVEGKGNLQSFCSCSHGAGRKMSRKEAKKTLDLKEEIRKMDEQGIIHGMRNKDDLDEASSAYKDIDTVMDAQKDLVHIVAKLKPIAVLKG